MSIVRKRSASNKVYFPSDTRENHYILAELPLTDELYRLIIPANQQPTLNLSRLYHQMSEHFFQLCQQFAIPSSLLIANDKLIRVRYNLEMHQWQTNQQIIVYYDPCAHQLKKSIYDVKIKAKKIALLFLATGADIRINAAGFHEKVCALLHTLREQWQLSANDIRLRDHQHLTYDLFSQQKYQYSQNQCHKLRAMNIRYASQGVALTKALSAMTYAVVTLAITRSILAQVEIDAEAPDRYNPLYSYLTDKFTRTATRFNINNGALLANGLIPIVRHSLHDIVSKIGELQMLGYNPDQNPCGIISKWDANLLVDDVYLIFVATHENCHNNGYAKFANQIEQALQMLAIELEMAPKSDTFMVRFHQHIAYNI